MTVVTTARAPSPAPSHTRAVPSVAEAAEVFATQFPQRAVPGTGMQALDRAASACSFRPPLLPQGASYTPAVLPFSEQRKSLPVSMPLPPGPMCMVAQLQEPGMTTDAQQPVSPSSCAAPVAPSRCTVASSPGTSYQVVNQASTQAAMRIRTVRVTTTTNRPPAAPGPGCGGGSVCVEAPQRMTSDCATIAAAHPCDIATAAAGGAWPLRPGAATLAPSSRPGTPVRFRSATANTTTSRPATPTPATRSIGQLPPAGPLLVTAAASLPPRSPSRGPAAAAAPSAVPTTPVRRERSLSTQAVERAFTPTTATGSPTRREQLSVSPQVVARQPGPSHVHHCEVCEDPLAKLQHLPQFVPPRWSLAKLPCPDSPDPSPEQLTLLSAWPCELESTTNVHTFSHWPQPQPSPMEVCSRGSLALDLIDFDASSAAVAGAADGLGLAVGEECAEVPWDISPVVPRLAVEGLGCEQPGAPQRLSSGTPWDVSSIAPSFVVERAGGKQPGSEVCPGAAARGAGQVNGCGGGGGGGLETALSSTCSYSSSEGEENSVVLHIGGHCAGAASNTCGDGSGLAGTSADTEAPSCVEEPWSTQQLYRLCNVGEMHGFQGKAMHLHGSVMTAVERLNQGTVVAPEGFCVVYSATRGAHVVLYRKGYRQRSLACLGLLPCQEATIPTPQPWLEASLAPPPSDVPQPLRFGQKLFCAVGTSEWIKPAAAPAKMPELSAAVSLDVTSSEVPKFASLLPVPDSLDTTRCMEDGENHTSVKEAAVDSAVETARGGGHGGCHHGGGTRFAWPTAAAAAAAEEEAYLENWRQAQADGLAASGCAQCALEEEQLVVAKVDNGGKGKAEQEGEPADVLDCGTPSPSGAACLGCTGGTGDLANCAMPCGKAPLPAQQPPAQQQQPQLQSPVDNVHAP